MDPVPGAVPAPGSKIEIDQQPGRQVMRQLSPRAAGPQQVNNGINNLPPRILDGPPNALRLRNHRFNQAPLSLVEVTGVALALRFNRSRQGRPRCWSGFPCSFNASNLTCPADFQSIIGFLNTLLGFRNKEVMINSRSWGSMSGNIGERRFCTRATRKGETDEQRHPSLRPVSIVE